MSFIGDLIGDVFGGITGAKQAGEAAQRAGELQSQAAQAGIEEQRRQFDKVVELMAPYVSAGQEAIGGFQPFQQAGMQAFEQQQALAGLRGPEAQQAAISQIESSPFLQSQIEQGERALLQRAGVTGGLRGGNVQAALAQFRPQMLQQAIEQQYGRLGGFAGTGLGVLSDLYTGGQAAAAGQAKTGTALAGSISNLLQEQGAARAGGELAMGSIPGRTFGDLLQIGGTIAGAGGFGGFGGAGRAPTGGGGLRF